MPQGVIAAISLAATVGGIGASVYSANQQSKYQKNIIREQQRQEEIRKNMMRVDAERKRLESLRQAQRARAMSLAATTNQGASEGSALGGAYGQISGQTGVNYSGINNAQAFGNAVFNSNAIISQNRMGMADASTIGTMGQGLTSLGGALMTAMPTFDRMNAQPYTPYSGGASYNYGQSYGGGGYPSLGFQSARF